MLNGRQKWICNLLFAVKGSYCERFEDDEDDPMLFGEGYNYKEACRLHY